MGPETKKHGWTAFTDLFGWQNTSIMSSDHLIADLGDGDHGYHFAIEPFLERSVIWLQNAETNEIW